MEKCGGPNIRTLYVRKEDPDPQYVGNWVGPWSGLEALAYRKIPSSFWVKKSDFLLRSANDLGTASALSELQVQNEDLVIFFCKWEF